MDNNPQRPPPLPPVEGCKYLPFDVRDFNKTGQRVTHANPKLVSYQGSISQLAVLPFPKYFCSFWGRKSKVNSQGKIHRHLWNDFQSNFQWKSWSIILLNLQYFKKSTQGVDFSNVGSWTKWPFHHLWNFWLEILTGNWSTDIYGFCLHYSPYFFAPKSCKNQANGETADWEIDPLTLIKYDIVLLCILKSFPGFVYPIWFFSLLQLIS